MTEPAKDPHRHDIGSRVAVAGHPVHAMLVSFPIALVCATLGGDLFYWWTGDPFFARVSLWTSGWGFWLGVAAAVVGAIELVAARGIRRRSESWTHSVAAMMLLAVIGANWGLRLIDREALVLPWGLYLSGLGLIFVGLAGWHGGKLVFEHQMGMVLANDD